MKPDNTKDAEAFETWIRQWDEEPSLSACWNACAAYKQAEIKEMARLIKDFKEVNDVVIESMDAQHRELSEATIEMVEALGRNKSWVGDKYFAEEIDAVLTRHASLIAKLKETK